MALGLGAGLWGVVVPKATENLITNPSGEFNSTGWTFIESGAIGTTAAAQQFGAWSIFCAPGANGTCGVYSPAWTSSNGSAYTVSAYIQGVNGIPYRMAIANSTGVSFLSGGTLTFTGGGTWQRYSISYTEPTGATRTLAITKNASADLNAFRIDGAQAEMGSLTTYIDGDQPGGTWTGARHASTTTRTDQYRGGGSVIALVDLGLQVDQMPGAGMPPIEDSSQSYAVTDGAQFQRQRAASRRFTLTAKPIIGTSLADLHNQRRTLIDVFKPDLVTPQQPIRFLYVGGQGTVQYDAYYDKGLELGNMDGIIAENAAISFNGYDPYWYAPTQQGTALVPRAFLGSVNYIARRSPQGAWSSMGVNGTTIKASAASASGITAIRSLAFNPGGTLFFGGWIGSAGGTLSPNIGAYYPNLNTFGTLQGGTTDQTGGQLLGVTFNPGGTLFLCGLWNTIAGTTTNHVARWNGAYGSLVGGTIAALNFVWTVNVNPLGSLFIGGDYTSAAGTNCNGMSYWTGAAFGTLGGTARNGGAVPQIQAFAFGAQQRVYFAGGLTTIMGTQGTAIGQISNGSFGTLQNPFANGGNAGNVAQLSIGPDGRLWQAGQVTNIAIGSAPGAVVWNGVQQSNVGSGFNFQSGYNNSSESWSVLADQKTGNVAYGGVFTKVGNINVPANYTVWNGYTFIPPDISFIGAGFTIGTVYALAQSNDGAFYIAGNFTGTAQAASVGTIINSGRAQVYPNLRMRNLATSGTARIYQLLNTTTNSGIYFDLTILPGEEVDLVLAPGQRSLQSTFRGNVFNTILPGSNLATWSLLPGTNYVSFFSDNDSLEASFFWQPRNWSVDSGTVY